MFTGACVTFGWIWWFYGYEARFGVPCLYPVRDHLVGWLTWFQGWIFVQKDVELSIGQYCPFWNCLACSTRKLKTVFLGHSMIQNTQILQLSVREKISDCLSEVKNWNCLAEVKNLKLSGIKTPGKRIFIHPCLVLHPSSAVTIGLLPATRPDNNPLICRRHEFVSDLCLFNPTIKKRLV